ncbi:ABC transporter permease subunit [Orrella sp. JC864]|uniref:ABC transporter permease n=1 Tax=Orrella sp. JC864 TaxID=3120298 RepID=UPI00300A0A1B
MSRRSSVSDLSYHLAMNGVAALALLILIGPVVVVLLTSLTDSQTLRFPPPGLSLDWYRRLFDPAVSGPIHRAAANSLTVAAWSACAAAALGGMAALALARSASRKARALDAFFMSPLILPGIAFGLAALVFFSWLGLRPSLMLMTIGHAVMIVPFVLRTTSASLLQLDASLLECSASLGAGRLHTFRRITLPIVFPGLAAGTFMAFMASIDNVPISLFLSSPRSDMLPIRMWGMMESTLDVRVAAVSGVLIVGVLLLMLLMERLTGLTRRLQGH